MTHAASISRLRAACALLRRCRAHALRPCSALHAAKALAPRSTLRARCMLLARPLRYAESACASQPTAEPCGSHFLPAGDALFQTHENLEHLAMMEVVLGPFPSKMIKDADRHAQRCVRCRLCPAASPCAVACASAVAQGAPTQSAPLRNTCETPVNERLCMPQPSAECRSASLHAEPAARTARQSAPPGAGFLNSKTLNPGTSGRERTAGGS